MNNREAAIAAMLRKGWVPTRRPVPAPPAVVVPAVPAVPETAPAPSYTLATSKQRETTAPSVPGPEAPASDLTFGFALIDLSEETIPDTSLSSASSSTPLSSRESLSLFSLATQSSLSCVSLLAQPNELQQDAALEEKQQETQQAGEDGQPPPDLPLDHRPGTDLFAPLPPFAMPAFSYEPPAAVRLPKRCPPSMHDWIVCSEVGLQLMRPARKHTISCVSCKNDCPDGTDPSSGSNPVFRSTFWRMTTCSAGHRPALPKDTPTSQAGLCRSCDKEYVLQVVRGKHFCTQEGCRHRLRVHHEDVADALWEHPGLLRAFGAVIQAHSGYECAIHFGRVDVDNGKKDSNEAATAKNDAPLTEACTHDRIACAPCLTRMCEAAIQGDRLDDLVCPEPRCRQRLTRETLREYVSAASLRLYDKKLAFAAMASNPNFRWCRCGHGQLHEAGNEQPQWTCGQCQAWHCFVCQDDEEDAEGGLCEHLRRAQLARALAAVRNEHERTRLTSETAVQQRQAAQNAVDRLAAQMRENTRSTQLVIASTTKRCPRLGCRAPIQRDEGCGHMTCRRCRTEFCWACKVIWKVAAGTVQGAEADHVSCIGTLSPLHLTTCKLASQRTIERRRLNKALYAHRWDEDRGYDESLDVDLWLPEDHQ